MVCMKEVDETKIYETIDKNLFDFIVSGTAYRDEDPVFTYFGKNFSYAYFKRNVDRYARILLADKTLKRGDRVVVSLLTMPESICLTYALNYIGLVPVMVDIRLSPAEMKKIITETEAQYAFVTDVNAKGLSLISEAACLRKFFVVPMAQSLGRIGLFIRKFSSFFTGNPYMFTRHFLPKVFLWKDFEELPQIPFTEKILPADGNSEMIFTTSGSTGDKKYVRHLARSLNLNVCINEFSFDFKDPAYAKMIAFMPLFVCFGFAGSVHLPFYYGMQVRIHMIYDLRKIPKVFTKVKPNYFVSSIGHWERIVSSKYVVNSDLSFLKFAMFSGENCGPEKLNRINDFLASRGAETPLLQAYGMTELTVVSIQKPGDPVNGNVGKPFPLIHISIVDPETGEVQKTGQTGEICVDSPCRTLGYFHDPAETAKLLQKHADGKIWVHTGDLGYLDEEGYLYFCGRIKGMLVSVSGTKVYLPAIETALSNCEAVQRCAAVSVNEEDTGIIRSIFLFVEPKKGVSHTAAKKKIRQVIVKELPSYLIPDSIEILSEMPLLPSGKTDRQTLKKKAEALVQDMRIPLVTLK